MRAVSCSKRIGYPTRIEAIAIEFCCHIRNNWMVSESYDDKITKNKEENTVHLPNAAPVA